MEQLENKAEQQPLKGEVQEPTQNIRTFKNLVAATDFVRSFGIDNYDCRSGYLPDGRKVVQIVYVKESV